MRKDAFRIAYDTHADFVWRMLRYSGVPAAEQPDAAQDVFEALAECLDELEADEVRPYLCGIVRNVSWKRRRWSGRLLQGLTRFGDALSASGLDRNRTDPEQESSRNADRERLMRLLGSLEARQREAFILRHLESMSLSEVARHTQTNINTVCSRLRLARTELKRALERELVKESWRYRWTI